MEGEATSVEATVSSKGQVRLPTALRSHPGIDTGTRIRFSLHSDGRFEAERVLCKLEGLRERERVLAALETLLQTRRVAEQAPGPVRKALEAMRPGEGGFADDRIAQVGFANGAREVIALDADFATAANVRRLK
jgi:bifunctional DNA-binding transcriptional regulator/antitoxin component of YhaV-PrlF toxin-antitoxin module